MFIPTEYRLLEHNRSYTKIPKWEQGQKFRTNLDLDSNHAIVSLIGTARYPILIKIENRWWINWLN